MRMDKQKNAQKPTLYIVQHEANDGPPMQDYFIWRKKKDEVPEQRESNDMVAGNEAETRNEIPENRTMAQDAIAVEMETIVVDTDFFKEIDIEMPAEEPEAKVETDPDTEEPAIAIKNAAAASNEGADSVQEEEAAAGQINKRDPSKQSALVQYFLQQMKEKEIKPDEPVVTTFGEPSDTTAELPESVERNAMDENAKKIWRMVNTLARYPKFLEPPLVAAVVNGENLTFQIDSKRGNKIRAKVGNEMKIIKIEDITEIKMI